MARSAIVFADETLSSVVREKLGENEEKLQNRVELFHQWLLTEDYLPKNIDLNYIKNVIRACNFDILKARKKFEMFMYAKMQFSAFFDYTGLLSENVFKFPMHRRATTSRNLTKDGYRIWFITFNKNDVSHLCVNELITYGYLIVEYLLWKDYSAGCIMIVDLSGFYMEFLGSTDIKTFKMYCDVFFKSTPVRLKNIHICNLTPASKVLVNVALTFANEKIKRRIIYHKSSNTLREHIDLSDLPSDYGGKADCLEEVSEDYRKFFFENRPLVQDIQNQKLHSQLPKEKKRYFSGNEDLSLAGSFRKLDID